MAGIDKTYTDSYEDYKEFKDWADAQVLTFFDGYKVCIGDWVRECDKEDFDNGEIPIMNTPTWLDIYLIQNCNSDFVLSRMKEVYGEEQYKLFQETDLSKAPSKQYTRNRKIRIKKAHSSSFPLHSRPYGGKLSWWIQCPDFSYNPDSDTWVSNDYPYPTSTNTSHVKSIKALVRHLRKQYLPKGIAFRLAGRYVGEEYLVKVS